MISNVMIAVLIGTMYRTPISPSGISSVNAASGPYAAELSASSPKIATPGPGPICSPRSSEVFSGFPTIMSTMLISCGWLRPSHSESAGPVVAQPFLAVLPGPLKCGLSIEDDPLQNVNALEFAPPISTQPPKLSHTVGARYIVPQSKLFLSGDLQTVSATTQLRRLNFHATDKK